MLLPALSVSTAALRNGRRGLFARSVARPATCVQSAVRKLDLQWQLDRRQLPARGAHATVRDLAFMGDKHTKWEE